jgi:hypothetical protein
MSESAMILAMPIILLSPPSFVSATINICIPQNIHRVALAPKRGQDSIELLDALREKLGKFSSTLDEGIRGHDPRPAAVRDNGEVRTPGEILGVEHLSRVEEIRDFRHPDNADPLQGHVVDRVIPRQCSRMRKGCLGALVEPARLHYDDRFVPGESTGGAHELPGIPHTLHVDYDAAGPLVVPEKIDEVAEVDVDH